MKQYIELKENANATHLKIETYYEIGGYNAYSGRNTTRGYYCSVSPVKRENRYGYVTESYEAFTGIKKCVKEVKRRSKKAEAEAENIAANDAKYLIDLVCQRNNFELA